MILSKTIASTRLTELSEVPNLSRDCPDNIILGNLEVNFRTKEKVGKYRGYMRNEQLCRWGFDLSWPIDRLEPDRDCLTYMIGKQSNLSRNSPSEGTRSIGKLEYSAILVAFNESETAVVFVRIPPR